MALEFGPVKGHDDRICILCEVGSELQEADGMDMFQGKMSRKGSKKFLYGQIFVGLARRRRVGCGRRREPSEAGNGEKRRQVECGVK